MSIFGINGAEFIVLLIVVVLVLGPSRTAQALVAMQRGVAKMRGWSAQLREQLTELREQEASAANAVAEETRSLTAEAQAVTAAATDVNSVLQSLDPSLLDPRTMIKEAVAEEMKAWIETMQPAASSSPAAPAPPAHNGPASSDKIA
ncbi:MAG: hypothetical protein MR006_01225 [Arcanobacterium sp.]|nr:hypothetical protein [Arcanobacterium sp.]MDY5589557.1 hypothetical protein [Arcanobacterium sp.]